MNNIKIAVVHDWFVTIGGAEKVLSQILAIFPDADVFSIVDFIPEEKRHFLRYKTVNVSFIQKLPFAKRWYRGYLPLMTYAIEQFDLAAYDLIISSSHAVAKGVLSNPNQLHICYCHTPIRYAWDLQHQYLQESNAVSGIKSFIMRWLLHKIRIWDMRTANGVDYFISNSNYIAKRIYKCYRRLATTIYPNVDTDSFVINQDAREDFYFTASRFVPYKKIDVVVRAFKNLPDKKLVVIGAGPYLAKIKKIATPNVEILGYQDDKVLIKFMQTCKAFIFAAEEDFGITPIEAQSCGTPVIAFGRGGALETIIDLSRPSPSGVFFDEQTEASIVTAIYKFEENIDKFEAQNCSTNAERFSTSRFKHEIYDFISQKIKKHFPAHKILNPIISEQRFKISVCIPTLNAMNKSAKDFLHTLETLKLANLYRVLIIDSSSDDNTLTIAKQFGFETKCILREDFDHGGTRQIAAEILGDSDYIIYLTQDVLIRDAVAINNLVNYVIKNNLAAAYGCQLAHSNAKILSRHLRKFNYGRKSYIRNIKDQIELGIKSAFASNSFSIYRVSDLVTVGGFPPNILLGEDMYVYSKLLLARMSVGYCADAIVWHSHNYSIAEDFKRYFDIGVFHNSFTSVINEFGAPEKEGVKYAKSEILYVIKHNIFCLPQSIIHTLAKYIGYKLGLRYKDINPMWYQKFSMHPKSRYWDLVKTVCNSNDKLN